MLCLNNVAGQGLDLERHPSFEEASITVISYRNHILYFASVEMDDIVKKFILLQENLIFGLLCQTAPSI